MNIRPLLIAALCLGLQTPVLAAPHLVSGQCTLDNVNRLTSQISWYQSLPQAEAAARSSGKMILWMHMLGNLSGATWSAGNSLRAVSLSQEPAFSVLKQNLVCGVRDISNEPYCGVSGRHEVDGAAINTTNGAGPHNIQMFILSSDGTVLTCMQGFWNANDFVSEVALANQLNQVYLNPNMTRPEKDRMFTQMHLRHIAEHSPQERKRSHLQSFDAKYEAKHRLQTSDCILDTRVAAQANVKGAKVPYQAFKTTDQVMHERMSLRPFQNYNRFDVASYVDYGRQKYEKHEDQREDDGTVNKAAAKNAPLIGNANSMQGNQQQQNGSTAGRMSRRAMRRMLRYGVRAAL